MFESIYTENYRNLADGIIQLRTKRGTVKRVVFLFGDNGVGKSSFIQVLAFLKQSALGLESGTVFDLREAAKLNRSMDANGLMVLMYKIIIDQKTYIYRLRFDWDGSIKDECLIRQQRKDCDVLFSRTAKGLYLDEKLLGKKDRMHFENVVLKQQRQCTSLALFYRYSKTPGVHIKKCFKVFLAALGRLHIQDDRPILNRYEGFIEESQVPKMRAKAILIGQLAKSVYPKIDHLSFVFRRQRGRVHYRLETYVNTKSGVKRWTHGHQPASYYQFIHLCDLLLDGISVCYDDIGRAMCPAALSFLLNRVVSKTNSAQLIFTAQSSAIMNEIDVKSIYLFQKKQEAAKIVALEDVETVRENHNIRKRYEAGVYKTFSPVSAAFMHAKLFAWYSSLMGQKFVTRGK